MAMAERALSEEAIFKGTSLNVLERDTFYIYVSSPASVEKAKEELTRRRVVTLILLNPLEHWAGLEEEVVTAGGNVDAQVVDSLIKLYGRVLHDTAFLLDFHSLRAGLLRLSSSRPISAELEHDPVGILCRVAAVAGELGITAEMAETMVERILPAIVASHNAAVAQALQLLLSAGVVEHLEISKFFRRAVSSHESRISRQNIYTGWGEFFRRAVSSHESRLLTLKLTSGGGSVKVLDKGALRELCAALSKSSCLQALELRDGGLDLEEEEFLSSAIVSPGCKLERLRIDFNSSEEEDVIGRRKSLSSALVHPNCKIWDLALYGLRQQSALTLIGEALRNEKNRLLMLTLGNIRATYMDMIPWEASMGDPACKVEFLSLDFEFGPPLILNLELLIQAARSKVWYLKVGAIDPHKVITKEFVEALKHSKVTHFEVHGASSTGLSALADFLGSATCMLECFEYNGVLTKKDAEELINALETNFQSRLKTLKIKTFIHDAINYTQRCEHIVKRNALFLAAGNTHQEPFVAAASAKLFICGSSGAGKTTIARNLNRRVTLPAGLQRHSTTQGIDMSTELHYSSSGKKAVICDIAGQEEFHAFHHYFVKGSQSNLFLVVCKVLADGGDNSNMKEDLKYWLRFISSHKPFASRRKPKVLITLNYYHIGKAGEFNSACVAQQYTDLLDIHKVVDGDGVGDHNNMCFQVVALRAADLKPIKNAVGVALEHLLESHPQVPALCKSVRDSVRIKDKKRWWWRCCNKQQEITQSKQRRVVTIEELVQRVLPAPASAGRDDEYEAAARTSAVKFTMACMHDMGESLYFGVDYPNDEVLASRAALDMQWFVQELVGMFIEVSREDDWAWDRHRRVQMREGDGEYSTISMINIVPKIEKMCSPEHLGYVLKALHEMGVLLPSDDNWNGTWSRTHPERVIVPALLQNDFSGTLWGSDGYIYWGRRLACKNTLCTLLPSGMFNVIQVKVRELCKNSSFTVGKGWVCFKENEVCVVVRVGGNTNSWVDRQWVDIMVMTLAEDNKCLLAEDMLERIKSYVGKECQSSLDLVEYVINPAHIKARVRDNIQQAAGTRVEPLEQIYKEALEQGLDYSHTWDRETSNEVAELLTPRELQACVKRNISSITSDYNESVASMYNTTKIEPWEDFLKNQSDPTVNSEVSTPLLKFLMQRLDNIDQRLVAIEAGILDLKSIAKYTQRAMEAYGQRVLAQCSKMLDKVDVPCPRYPYFTDYNNKIAKHYLVVAERVKLHYCCESSGSRGIHPVRVSDGLELELAHDWFKKKSHIIVPALLGIYFTIKIAGKALGAGELFDSALDFAKGAVESALDSVLTPELTKNRKLPTESDLNELFAMVEKKLAQGEKLEHYIEHKFGLKREKGAWRCGECR